MPPALDRGHRGHAARRAELDEGGQAISVFSPTLMFSTDCTEGSKVTELPMARRNSALVVDAAGNELCRQHKMQLVCRRAWTCVTPAQL